MTSSIVDSPEQALPPAEDESTATGEEERPPLGLLHGNALLLAGIGVGLILAAGVWLRFWTRSALWLDEALTVDIARLPLSHLHAALKQDGAPPLYYVLLHFWMLVFGQSNSAVRSLSGVLSVATIPITWVAARRFAGRPVAWMVVVLVASSPFAVYYATEVRMYSLVMFLTACGFVALERALHQPRWGNLLGVAASTAGLLYTQYWALYLVGTIGLWLLWQSWRAAEPLRAKARFTLGAVVVGCIAFLPWVPTFLYQSKHTGTPWAVPPNFAAVVNAITGFTNNQATLSTQGSSQGRLLSLIYFSLGALALFGLAKDRLHIDLDIRTRAKGRPLAFVVVLTLMAAIAGGILTGSAYSPRYAAVVFIPVIVLVGFGAVTLIDARVRTGMMIVAAVAGFAVAVQNVYTQRSQAPEVAAVLAAHAKPGDIVAYCPDQLGPALYRLLPGGTYQQITYPRGTGPDLIDWVDYQAAIRAADPVAFAKKLEENSGGVHDIWFVSAPQYQGFENNCPAIATALIDAPGWGAHQWVNPKLKHYYEPYALTQFAPPAAVAAAKASDSGSAASGS